MRCAVGIFGYFRLWLEVLRHVVIKVWNWGSVHCNVPTSPRGTSLTLRRKASRTLTHCTVEALCSFCLFAFNTRTAEKRPKTTIGFITPRKKQPMRRQGKMVKRSYKVTEQLGTACQLHVPRSVFKKLLKTFPTTNCNACNTWCGAFAA